MLKRCLVVHKLELLLWIDEILVDGVKRANLACSEEVPHHGVQDSHRGGFEVSSEGPVEREGEEGVKGTLPGRLVRFPENIEVLHDEPLKEAAKVNYQLDVNALEGLALLMEF